MLDEKDIKQAGLKVTLPRMKILAIFQQSKVRHLTADDVYRQLLAVDEDVGLATVYRVLTQFEQAGILTRSNFDTGKAIFELKDDDHHDHLVCVVCGRVEEFHDDEIELRQRVVAQQHGFFLQSHALSLYGVCRVCKSPEKN